MPKTPATPRPPRPATPVEEELAQVIPEAGGPHLWLQLGRWALRLIPVLLLIAAGVILWRAFRTLSLAEVLAAMAAWGHEAVLGAIALSAVSFVLMGVVEWLGLRWAGARLPWGVAMAGSFLANAIAHSIGANLLVSGAVRARLYSRHGVTLRQVAATTLFAGLSFGVGLAALGGWGLAFAGAGEIAHTAIPLAIARPLGWTLMVGALGWIALCAVRRRPLRAFGHTLELPSAVDAALQLVVGVVDNAIAAAIVWVLLPAGAVSYATFVGAYAVACVAGLASSVPGGAGVFESSLATLLHGVSAAPLAAAFLGYRLAYYLLPLVIAAVALAADTLIRAGKD
ncbi:MAG: lysylphosphatidylglycerol synthase domain-containing protein [Phenylobacterium sp.]